MTQARPASISLATQSTELPIAWDVMPVGAGQPTAQVGKPLVLLPGRSGELLLRSRNNSHQPVQLSLAIRGNHHAGWIHEIGSDPEQVTWSQSLTGQVTELTWQQTLPPKTSFSEVLTFQIPTEFFEAQQVLQKDNTLTLQYQSELSLYASLPGEAKRQLVGHQVVDLYIRPDSIYTNFLPEIYQQSDFLSRFLSIFEQAFEPTVQTLDDFWAYLDPLTAPKALLPFLAEWVAWPLNPNWTLQQQRRLIRHAVEFYRWRGTRHGLQLALSLITDLPNDDKHISILEDHQADFVIGEVTLADTPMLGGGRAFHFSVRLRPPSPAEAERIDIALVRTIIEQEKPAFCTYDLAIEPFL